MASFLIIVYIICCSYMILNFKYDLQMFQQNSYRIPRYWKWLSKNIGSTWRLFDIACLFMLFSTLIPAAGAALIIAIVALGKIFLIFNKKYKKPLVFTSRVWRLYILSAIISLGIFVAFALPWTASTLYSTPQIALGVLLVICILSFFIVILADIILIPVERAIRNYYIKDAKRILKSSPNLKIIGITGSYGKTSTKHYLNHILSEEFDVLMTPGSYNTPMGVVRTIREYLKPYNEIFICEMGAKQLGDIQEICRIVNPQYGILTAVGQMHLETFKTIENVQRTKFELIDSLPSDGVAVINNDFPYCADRTVNNVKAIRYGIMNTRNCDYIAHNIKYSSSGTLFDISGPDGFEMSVETSLLGECNVSDLLAAIIMALQMGMDKDKIHYAVSTISQVEHRLSIKRTPAGVTILDDAFNSNPAGSGMAVDVLSQFTDGKRIIVTPGMIELGKEQYDLNKELGRHIGLNLDIAIIVGEYNREALVEGIRSTDFKPESLYEVDTFNDAQKVLATILKPGDTILYENDLPDTFK